MTTADLYSTKLKNDYQAWLQLKQISRQVIKVNSPEKYRGGMFRNMNELVEKGRVK